MTPEDWLAAVRLRLLVIVNCVALGLLGGALVTVFQPESYRSVSTVYVVPNTAQITATDLYRGGQLADQRAKLYQTLGTSPRVLDPVIAELSLGTTADLLRARVSVSAVGGGSLVVAASDSTPGRAKALADAVAGQLIKLSTSLESGPSGPPVELRVGASGSIAGRPETPDPLSNLAIGAGVGAGLAAVAVAVTAGLLVVRRRSSRAVWVHLRQGDDDVLVLGRVLASDPVVVSEPGLASDPASDPAGLRLLPLVTVGEHPRLLTSERR